MGGICRRERRASLVGESSHPFGELDEDDFCSGAADGSLLGLEASSTVATGRSTSLETAATLGFLSEDDGVIKIDDEEVGVEECGVGLAPSDACCEEKDGLFPTTPLPPPPLRRKIDGITTRLLRAIEEGESEPAVLMVSEATEGTNVSRFCADFVGVSFEELMGVEGRLAGADNEPAASSAFNAGISVGICSCCPRRGGLGGGGPITLTAELEPVAVAAKVGVGATGTGGEAIAADTPMAVEDPLLATTGDGLGLLVGSDTEVAADCKASRWGEDRTVSAETGLVRLKTGGAGICC